MEYGLVAVWVLAFAALAAVGLPIAARLFASVPGRGAGFSIPIGLAVVTIVAFWVGHLVAVPIAAFAGIVVLVALASLALRGGIRNSRPLVLDARAVAGSAAVFLVAFLFFVAIRAVDPGITPSHEEFINFGLINAVLRTGRLPPTDMWFAGEPVNYYYGGHLATALLTELIGTTPAYAYNLALAGFYALLATTAFELAGAVAAARERSRELAGAVAAVFACFAGNLLTALQAVVWVLPDAISEPLVDALTARLSWGATGQLEAGIADFNYYGASRVIPGTVNEFPLMTWLNGQLHAHMMSTPFLLLVAALGFAYYRTPEEELRRRRGLVFVAIPIVAGLVATIDLWSFPATVGLTWLALAFAPTNPLSLLPDPIETRVGGPVERIRDLDDPIDRLRAEVARTGGSAVLALVVLAGGLLALPILVRAGDTGASIALVGPRRRGDLLGLFVVHGAFLIVFVAYLRTHARIHAVGARRFLALFVLVGLAAVVAGAEAVALFAPLLLVGWYALRVSDDAGFETLLLVAGLGLVLVIEFLYVDDPSFFPGRQNTVYKVYMQTWVLWSVAAGAMLPAVARGRNGSWSLDRRRIVGVVFAVLVISSVGSYGALAAQNWFTQPAIADYDEPTDPTLDGLAFAEANHPEEAAAIHWLDNRTSAGGPDGTNAPDAGNPTLVSAPGGPYAWAAPAATYTGIPTVAGWWHAAQYHGDAAFRDRVDDVNTIYAGTPADRVALLEQYSVEYVYLGPTERERYDVRAFTELDGIEVAHENDAVTIYRVDQSRLGYSGNFTAESRTYAASDLRVGGAGTRSNDRITTASDATGVVWRGPRTALPAGNYTAAFRINATRAENESRAGNGSAGNETVTSRNASATVARLAVTADTGAQTVASTTIPDTGGWTTVVVPFELDRARSNVEFRGRITDRGGSVAIETVSLGVQNATANAARRDGHSPG